MEKDAIEVTVEAFKATDITESDGTASSNITSTFVIENEHSCDSSREATRKHEVIESTTVESIAIKSEAIGNTSHDAASSDEHSARLSQITIRIIKTLSRILEYESHLSSVNEQTIQQSLNNIDGVLDSLVNTKSGDTTSESIKQEETIFERIKSEYTQTVLSNVAEQKSPERDEKVIISVKEIKEEEAGSDSINDEIPQQKIFRQMTDLVQQAQLNSMKTVSR
jgi:hypothetical protein